MKITCYGSRGSLPSPSRKYDEFYTDEFGGNTTCYYIEAGPFKITIDYGSGAAGLGNKIMRDDQFGHKGAPNKIQMISLLTHYHSDHIQGIGFHAPFYIGSNEFHFHGPHPSNEEHSDTVINEVQRALAENQEAPYFPVPHRELPARKSYVTHSAQFSESFYYTMNELDELEYIPDPDNDVNPDYYEEIIKITTVPLNHPNDCLGYMVEYKGKKIAFCTDDEPLRYVNKNLKNICRGADILFKDGQYTETQIFGMCQGFGHGTPLSCLEDANAAEIPHLVVIHHDPGHDDTKLHKMEAELNESLEALKKTDSMLNRNLTEPAPDCPPPLENVLQVEFAKEGKTWEI